MNLSAGTLKKETLANILSFTAFWKSLVSPQSHEPQAQQIENESLGRVGVPFNRYNLPYQVPTNLYNKQRYPKPFHLQYNQGGFAKWSTWSHCSSRCGRGIRVRTRACTETFQGDTINRRCLGPTIQKRHCHIRICPGTCSTSKICVVINVQLSIIKLLAISQCHGHAQNVRARYQSEA